VQVRATKQIRATNTKMLCWQNIPAGHSPTPPLSSLIRRFSRVSWITIKSHHRPPGLWAHPALSTVARGYRHIRTSWGYRHIQACTSSSPGAIGTSRLVQAIGTAPHHPLTIDHCRCPLHHSPPGCAHCRAHCCAHRCTQYCTHYCTYRVILGRPYSMPCSCRPYPARLHRSFGSAPH